MVVLDTWQYFMHRYMHHNKFLYKHIHSQHHRLVVPYAFGALYNHPLEGLLLDTIGGALSFLLSGMSPRVSIFFFSFATIKTVDDHCGLWLPGNLFHLFFKNNTAYHDVHHQLYGTKYNFSQPFFVTWDRILGTYMPYSLEKRTGGGFEARPTKEYKDIWLSAIDILTTLVVIETSRVDFMLYSVLVVLVYRFLYFFALHIQFWNVIMGSRDMHGCNRVGYRIPICPSPFRVIACYSSLYLLPILLWKGNSRRSGCLAPSLEKIRGR